VETSEKAILVFEKFCENYESSLNSTVWWSKILKFLIFFCFVLLILVKERNNKEREIIKKEK
jgi:hypothetical protein